ncbi:hypothetical protein ENVG_00310 [Emiliania huxleyi virus 84]|nr:hypothetical protein ENVG_00310 [Emiliania huxleyi virus 84]AEP15339.1 hypothetical protein EOVG_00402 [Emiliania huxleyi virus 88]AEP15779.1 hypothetical protein EQVG_00370 [Emiliania huxleyi virus 207]AEP16164.1 hypothetical protein ERVG_00289 [Emiliania huxleyi virus 208]AET42799.1 hypothetical protein EXVG_00150 [Emiliania huxleyi virus 202]
MQLSCFRSFLIMTINQVTEQIQRYAITQALCLKSRYNMYLSNYEILTNAQDIIGDTSIQTIDETCNILFGAGYRSYAHEIATHLVKVGIGFAHIRAALSDNDPSYIGAMVHGNVIKSWGDLNDPTTLEFVKIYSELRKRRIDSDISNV